MSVNGLKTIPLKNKIPQYGFPISRNSVSIDDMKIMATIQLNGIPFESESWSTIEQAFNVVKGVLNSLGKQYGSSLAAWTHIVKKKDELHADYKFENSFMQEFSDKYINTFKGENFFNVKYYITFVYNYKDLDEGNEVIEDILKLVLSAFKRFDCRVLDVDNNGRCKNVEFLNYLMNYETINITLNDGKVSDTICRSDLHFGYDLLELRNNDSQKSKFATFYEVDAFSNKTECGMWDFILTQQCEFILTQSMIFMRAPAALNILKKQSNLIASSDAAANDLEEIEVAKDYTSSGEIGWGDYHGSLTIIGESPEQVLKEGSDLAGEFLARGAMFKRANLKSQFTFFSTLPASKQRIKSSPRTTTNLACSWSLHNYSRGKPYGNPIGDGSAILPLKTLSHSLFYLNCHASELNKDVTGEKYPGHTMILGASGTGKTTLEATITGFFTRFNQQIFCIDYKRSTEMFIRAFGGEYFTIKEGEDTGINLFQLEPTPKLIGFLNMLVCRLAADTDSNVNPHHEREIKMAIDSVMKFEPHQRGLSMMLQSIQDSELRLRLSKWCRSQNGKLAWCLDSARNAFNPRSMDRVGFDSTLLLERNASGGIHPASEPILACLFFYKELMQESGKLIETIVEEFWMPANFPLTQAVMSRSLKTGRLMNEFMILSSQSPEDAIECNIFPAIIQQTATKIYLPNPDAEYASYQRCNITKGEFDKLQKLDKQSRTFLVKQSNTSCFAKMDLFGFERQLPIISGSTDDITLCESIRSQVGNDPEIWIPEFLKIKYGKLS